MDPTECLRRLLSAAVERDYPETVQACSELLNWLLCGGFVPENTPADRLQLANGLAKLVDQLEDYE